MAEEGRVDPFLIPDVTKRALHVFTLRYPDCPTDLSLSKIGWSNHWGYLPALTLDYGSRDVRPTYVVGPGRGSFAFLYRGLRIFRGLPPLTLLPP